MRVLAGEAKGRRLRSVAGKVRPTEGRVRAALFSALGDRVAGARVLDLYAGSGSLGIEALSRGAASATFVERDPDAVAAIQANLAAAGLSGRARVVGSAVQRFLARQAGERFDLVFVDPPYAEGLPSAALERLGRGGLLEPAGTVVVETATRILPVPAPPGLEVVAVRRYGDSALVWLRRTETGG